VNLPGLSLKIVLGIISQVEESNMHIAQVGNKLVVRHQPFNKVFSFWRLNALNKT